MDNLKNYLSIRADSDSPPDAQKCLAIIAGMNPMRTANSMPRLNKELVDKASLKLTENRQRKSLMWKWSANLVLQGLGSEATTPLPDLLHKNSKVWPGWKYEVDLKMTVNDTEDFAKSIKCTMNMLQVAIICEEKDHVNSIINSARHSGSLKDVIKQNIKCDIPTDCKIDPDSIWIRGCSSFHLAVWYLPESLVYFLQFQPDLVNQQTTESKSSPLHISSGKENPVATTILLWYDANPDVQDSSGKTPLFVAVSKDSVSCVIALIYQGKAQIIFPNIIKEHNPYFVSRSSQIFEILMRKADETTLSTLNSQNIFEQVLNQHSSSLQMFLNLMVSEEKLHPDDKVIIFNLELFKTGTTKKNNHMDKHLEVVDKDKVNDLKHPLMWLFSDIKWYKHRVQYLINFTIFFFYLITLTVNAYNFVDIVQCKSINKGEKTEGFGGHEIDLKYITCLQCPDKTNSWKLTNQTKFGVNDIFECVGDHVPEALFYKRYHVVTMYLSLCHVAFLFLIEIGQFASMAKNGQWLKYFGVQNIIEVGIYTSSTVYLTFLVDYDIRISQHVLGWTMFFAWIDLTLFLGRFGQFGKNIYLSIYVIKKVAWSLIVYIPSLIAFSSAYHVFLHADDVFASYWSSFLEVMTMMLGEVDFGGHFSYPVVKEIGGSNVSVQVS